MNWHGWLTRPFSPSSLLRSTAKTTLLLHTPVFLSVILWKGSTILCQRVVCVSHHSAPLAHSFLDAIMLSCSQAALCWTAGKAAGPNAPRSTSEREASCHYTDIGPSFWKSHSLQVFMLCCDWLTDKFLDTAISTCSHRQSCNLLPLPLDQEIFKYENKIIQWIIELFGWKEHFFHSIPVLGQGHLPLNEAPPSPFHPCLEHFQGWCQRLKCYS